MWSINKTPMITLPYLYKATYVERSETVRKILKEDLDIRKFSAKMVPKNLTDEQKQQYFP